MNDQHEKNPITARLRSRAMIDGMVIVAGAAIMYVVSSRFELFERVSWWVVQHQSGHFYYDLMIVAVFLLIMSPVFVWRRRTELLEQIRERERAEREKALLLPVLEDALHEVQALSRLLPVCAWCKKIRDDQGYWSQVDAYLQNNTSVVVTHGICPDCAKKVSNGEMK
jgi:hypothetical protein